MVNIVGMMWNKNEGDLLPYIIPEALKKVDTLFIADDGSNDKSWDIIQSFAKANKKIEHIQQNPNKKDPAQRQSLLDEIRRRYRPEDTWVQLIESDIIILDTDVREAIRDYSKDDITVNWVALNAVKKNGQEWLEDDKWPNWDRSIQEVMPYGHWMEQMLYTFRPLPQLYYPPQPWRPWPRGYASIKPIIKKPRKGKIPLLAHYGFRGPTHFYHKYKRHGKRHPRYTDWDLTSVESILKTVYFFNGQWNGTAVPMSRQGWCGS